MKQFRTDILIFLGLLSMPAIVLLLTAGNSTIDIQLHDTYFVFDKISMTLLIMGPLTFLIFLARAPSRKFKADGANIGVIFGLVLVTLITFHSIRLQQSYLQELLSFDDQGLPDKQQLLSEAKSRIAWNWSFIGFWIVGLLLFTIWTIKNWNSFRSGTSAR